MILDVLHRIANRRQSLSREEARAVMAEVLTGQCSDAQIAALLVALHMKGETVEEIVGFAEAIRAAAIPLELHGDSVLDASGTGRDALRDSLVLIPAAPAAMPAGHSTFPRRPLSSLPEPACGSPSTAIAV